MAPPPAPPGGRRRWRRLPPWAALATLALASLSACCCYYYYYTARWDALSPAGPPPRPPSSSSSSPGGGSPVRAAGVPVAGGRPEELLHVAVALTRAGSQPGLRAKAAAALRSLGRRAELGPGQALVLHLLTDGGGPGAPLAAGPPPQHGGSSAAGLALLLPPLEEALRRDAPASLRYQVVVHEVAALAAKLRPVVQEMREVFSAGAGAYYAQAIFFLSVALHRLLPDEISRIIQVDLDVEYRANIRELFEEFDRFPEGAVIGIAREMQPVYRHIFWQYRKEHPDTRVGDPPPEGLPGFNSGVLLLDLEAMRRSELYNRLLEAGAIRRLAEKFHFRGHLGDQDFFTLVGMEHPQLFHLLDCTWNRQLCLWWRDHGYSDVFERYFRCEGTVKIYHGNCNTPIPQE